MSTWSLSEREASGHTIATRDHPRTPPVPAPPLPRRRPSPARPREPGPTPAARRLQANGAPPETAHDGSPVVGRPGQSLDRLEAGAGHRVANTVLRWQRRRFREHWTKLSGPPTAQPVATSFRQARYPTNGSERAHVTRIASVKPCRGNQPPGAWRGRAENGRCVTRPLSCLC